MSEMLGAELDLVFLDVLGAWAIQYLSHVLHLHSLWIPIKWVYSWFILIHQTTDKASFKQSFNVKQNLLMKIFVSVSLMFLYVQSCCVCCEGNLVRALQWTLVQQGCRWAQAGPGWSRGAGTLSASAAVSCQCGAWLIFLACFKTACKLAKNWGLDQVTL